MDPSFFSNIVLTAVRNFPAKLRTEELIINFITETAKTWFDTEAEQVEFLTNVCSAIEAEGLIEHDTQNPPAAPMPEPAAPYVAPVIHTQIVYNLILPPGGLVAQAAETVAPMAAATPEANAADAVLEAAIVAPEESVAENEPATVDIPNAPMEEVTEKCDADPNYDSAYPALPTKPVVVRQSVQPIRPATPAEQVRDYLRTHADVEVTTRDLGRVIRPPNGAHMVVWLRTLPFVDILGHSANGGNILKLRTPGAHWYMLDAKRHIDGPYSLAEIKQKTAKNPQKIRYGSSGKFQLSSEFAF